MIKKIMEKRQPSDISDSTSQNSLSKFGRFWKKLDNNQKTGIVAIALTALTLPVGTLAVLHEVRNRSQAYLPVTPPIYPTPTPNSTIPNHGTYIYFDNDGFNNTYFETTPSTPLISTPFTLETWVKVAKPNSGDYLRDYSLITYTKPMSPSDYGYLFKLSLETQESSGMTRPMFSILKANSFSADRSPNYIDVGSTSSISLSPDTWNHIAITGSATGDNCTLTLYINGLIADSRSQYSPNCAYSLQNPQKLTIAKNAPGASGVSGYYYHGSVDLIRISNTLRYTSEFPNMPHPKYEPQVDANTLLQLGFNNSLADASQHSHLVTAIGNRYEYRTDLINPSPRPTSSPYPSPSMSPYPSPSPISCARNMHTVSMQPNTQSGAPGSTLYYEATITNNDSIGCGASYFNASSRLPGSDWSASISPPTPLIAPGSSRVITVGFTSPISAVVRTEAYPVGTQVAGPSGTIVATSAYYVSSLAPSPTSSPRPSASPYPSMSPYPSPSPYPTPTSIPTATPTTRPTPTPSTNSNPIILTQILPRASTRSFYTATITTIDFNRDPVKMIASGLPQGLSLSRCTTNNFFRLGTAQCTISGRPTKIGSYTVYITAADNRGGKTTKKFNLIVR